MRAKALGTATRHRENSLVAPAIFFLFWLAGFWFMLHAAG